MSDLSYSKWTSLSAMAAGKSLGRTAAPGTAPGGGAAPAGPPPAPPGPPVAPGPPAAPEAPSVPPAVGAGALGHPARTTATKRTDRRGTPICHELFFIVLLLSARVLSCASRRRHRYDHHYIWMRPRHVKEFGATTPGSSPPLD